VNEHDNHCRTADQKRVIRRYLELGLHTGLRVTGPGEKVFPQRGWAQGAQEGEPPREAGLSGLVAAFKSSEQPVKGAADHRANAEPQPKPRQLRSQAPERGN
jgi:hypothetical protein